MPWYEPKETPPILPFYGRGQKNYSECDGYHDYLDNDYYDRYCEEDEMAGEYEFEGPPPDVRDSVATAQNEQDDRFYQDPLSRRLENLLSPMIPTVGYDKECNDECHDITLLSTNQSRPNANTSPYPHPSFTHRHNSNDCDQFFYSPENALKHKPSQQNLTLHGCQSLIVGDEHIKQEYFHSKNENHIQCTKIKVSETPHGLKIRPHNSFRQTTLVQNNLDGQLTAVRSHHQSQTNMDYHKLSWDNIGVGNSYNDGSTAPKNQRSEKNNRKSKKKNINIASDSVSTVRGMNNGLQYLQSKNNDNENIAMNNQRKQSELKTYEISENHHPEEKSRKKNSQQSKKRKGIKQNKVTTNRKKVANNAVPVNKSPKQITFETLQQLSEECNVKNAACSTTSLRTFLKIVKSQEYIAWTIIFHDHICSTPFLPSTMKYCTEKGPRCTMWNCTCDNQVRAMQAFSPLVGAMFVFPAQSQNSSSQPSSQLDCFLLPLGPTAEPDERPSDIDPGYERMVEWPVLPMTCDTTLKQRWDAFASILMDKHLTCVTFNASMALMPYHVHCEYDTQCEQSATIEKKTANLIIPRIWDLRLASWILSPHSKEEDFELEKKCNGFPQFISSRQASINCNTSGQLSALVRTKEDLEFLYRLFPTVDMILDRQELKTSFDGIESPLQSVLSAMECFGIGFQPERLLNIQSQIESRIQTLELEARHLSKDESLLLSSPAQVSRLLFDTMQIPLPKGLKSKQVQGSQHRSTSEEALKAIQKEKKSKGNKKDGYRIIDILLEFRTLNKMLTTYIRPYPEFAREHKNPVVHIRTSKKRKRSKKGNQTPKKTLRIYPMWMQTTVRTGRLSCRKPNLQQVPTGKIFGVMPRNAFISSSEDKCLFACDYSQNEVRILAHMSNDNALLSLFQDRKNIDIYKQMSSSITGKSLDHVSDKERAIAKQVTLAIMYGMGIPQVSKKLGVSHSVAQTFFSSFYRKYEGVKQWMDKTIIDARRLKYVKTIAGRRRYLDDIDSDDNSKKAQAERQAINTVIQGSAADLTKLAMLKMASQISHWKKIGCGKGGSGIAPKILLQIHDELLFEIMANEIDIDILKSTVMRCCVEECSQELKLKSPLKLKCSVGISWANMKEI